MPSHSNHVDGESDIDGEDAEDNLGESDEDDNDMMPEKPQKPVSLNDCFKSLETIRDFYQSHGGDESVFNSVKNLEKVSLALSLQATSHKQSKVTEFFKKWIVSSLENDVLTIYTEISHIYHFLNTINWFN